VELKTPLRLLAGRRWVEVEEEVEEEEESHRGGALERRRIY